MPNHLEEELRAIQRTIVETRKRYGCLTDEGKRRIAELRAREHEILRELGANK